MSTPEIRHGLADILRSTARNYVAALPCKDSAELMGREIDALLSEWEAGEGSPENHAKRNESYHERRKEPQTAIH